MTTTALTLQGSAYPNMRVHRAVEPLDGHAGLLQELLLRGERQVWRARHGAARPVLEGDAGLCCH